MFSSPFTEKFSFRTRFVHQFPAKMRYDNPAEEQDIFSFHVSRRFPAARDPHFSPHFPQKPGSLLPGFCVVRFRLLVISSCNVPSFLPWIFWFCETWRLVFCRRSCYDRNRNKITSATDGKSGLPRGIRSDATFAVRLGSPDRLHEVGLSFFAFCYLFVNLHRHIFRRIP